MILPNISFLRGYYDTWDISIETSTLQQPLISKNDIALLAVKSHDIVFILHRTNFPGPRKIWKKLNLVIYGTNVLFVIFVVIFDL